MASLITQRQKWGLRLYSSVKRNYHTVDFLECPWGLWNRRDHTRGTECLTAGLQFSQCHFIFLNQLGKYWTWDWTTNTLCFSYWHQAWPSGDAGCINLLVVCVKGVSQAQSAWWCPCTISCIELHAFYSLYWSSHQQKVTLRFSLYRNFTQAYSNSIVL